MAAVIAENPKEYPYAFLYSFFSKEKIKLNPNIISPIVIIHIPLGYSGSRNTAISIIIIAEKLKKFAVSLLSFIKKQ